MRRILILTQPLHNNYGGVLQAYALQNKLKDMGHDVTTDRCHDPLRGDKSLDFKYRKHRLLSTIGRILRWRRPFLSPYYPNLTRYERMLMLGEHIQHFVESHISTIDLFDQRGRVREEIPSQFDTFIVGSDQVWRPQYNFAGGVESYFFSFLEGEGRPKVRRIAYAASFGLDNLSEFKSHLFKSCGELLHRFTAISVREASGVALCRDGFGVEAKQLIDPTLLYTKEHYSSLALDIEIRRRLLNVYMLDESPTKLRAVEMAAKELELETNILRPKRPYPTIRIEDAKLPSVEEWIAGFRDSEFVITDSFHGLIFSILYEKQFLAIVNDDRGAARFTSVAKQFGLERCVIRLGEGESIRTEDLDPRIDYIAVRAQLNVMREEAVTFLREALG